MPHRRRVAAILLGCDPADLRFAGANLCPLDVSPHDFSRADQLIDKPQSIRGNGSKEAVCPGLRSRFFVAAFTLSCSGLRRG